MTLSHQEGNTRASSAPSPFLPQPSAFPPPLLGFCAVKTGAQNVFFGAKPPSIALVELRKSLHSRLFRK